MTDSPSETPTPFDDVDRAAQVFGLRETQLAQSTWAMRDALVELWTATYGDLRSLDQDLNQTKRFFDPVATGARLRTALAEVPDVPVRSRVPEQCALELGDGRFLITPEGRCAIELLGMHETDDEVVVLQPYEIRDMLLAINGLYRDWGRHRLRSVIGLLKGEDKILQVPAAAVALALLVNRNTAPDRALTRPAERDEQRIAEETFFPAADAFSQSVYPSDRRSTTKERLVGGWRLHEVIRRAPAAIDLSTSAVYVRQEHEDELIDLIARELARRPRVDAERIGHGFDAMVDELRKRLPRLRTLGQAFERPAETTAIRRRLLERFEAARRRG